MAEIDVEEEWDLYVLQSDVYEPALFQFPLIASSSTLPVIDKARVKPQSERLELISRGPSASTKLLSSQVNQPNMGVGMVDEGSRSVYLLPLFASSYQFRPSFEHLDRKSTEEFLDDIKKRAVARVVEVAKRETEKSAEAKKKSFAFKMMQEDRESYQDYSVRSHLGEEGGGEEHALRCLLG